MLSPTWFWTRAGCAGVVVAAAAAIGLSAELVMTDNAGAAVRWNEWLAAHGPAAVVVWGSWMPGAEAAAQWTGILQASAQRGLTPVVVAVQEPYEVARSALEGGGIAWLHDRHGLILKEYRVIRVPALLVVARDGRLLDRLDPSPEAIAAWRPAPGVEHPH